MKVVLLQDVPRLGSRGDVVTVAEGYARNYLIPKGIAQAATEGRLKEADRKKKEQAEKADRLEAQARKIAARLESITVRIPAKVGEGEKLFGSVTNKEIAKVLVKEHGLKIDRKKIELAEPIKRLGQFVIQVRLYPGVQAGLAVEVYADDS